MIERNEFPENLGQLDDRIRDLRDAVERDASVKVIGRAAALMHLDRISRIQTYEKQLDVFIGFELLSSQLPPEEFIPRMNTTLRMQVELTNMFLGHISGLLDCFGGPAAIGLQYHWEMVKDDPVRQEILFQYLVAGNRCRRRPRRKNR